jgi:WHEP-TRS domain
LKAEKADKSAVQPHVEALLALKAKYESITGEPFDVPKADAKGKSKKQQHQKPAAASQSQVSHVTHVSCVLVAWSKELATNKHLSYAKFTQQLSCNTMHFALKQRVR